MTVYWCDPYLESSNGGIHGTSGNGSGTYASPFKLSHLLSNNSSNVLSTFSNGDELRFKGLADSTFWGSALAWSSLSTTGSPQYVRYYYLPSGSSDSEFYYALTKTGGDRVFVARASSSYNYFNCTLDNHWGQNFPQLQGDATGNDNKCYKFNNNYRIDMNTQYSQNGSNSTFYYLRGGTSSGQMTGISQFHGLKVTAGWTSETAKNGITYLMFTKYSDNQSHYWGGSGSSQMGLVNWDCYDGSTTGNTTGGLYIGYSHYANMHIYGGDVKLYGFSDNNYGYNTKYIYSNSDISLYFYGGEGACRGYIYANQSSSNYDADTATKLIHEYRVDVSCSGYNNDMSCYLPSNTELANFSNTTPRHIKYRSKVHTGYYGRYFYAYTSTAVGQATITLDDGYYFGYYSGGINFSDSTTGLNPITETIGTPDAGAPYVSANSSIKENTGFGGLGQSPSSNQSWYNLASSPRRLVSSATSLFGKASIGTAYSAYNSTINMTAGETYETATGNPLSFTSTPPQYTPYRTVLMSNSVDFRPAVLMGPEYAQGPSILTCNSPSNSNKLLWHFFNDNNGYNYSDAFALQIPDYSTYDLRLNGDFTVTSGAAISVIIQIWYTKNNSGQALTTSQYFGPFSSPTTTATSIVFAETITSSALTTANPASMWAWVKVTKGNNTKGNLIYNQLDLTQIT